MRLLIETLLSATILFFGTLGTGFIPIVYMNKLIEKGNGEMKYLKYISDFGIGMLLGTSCLLVIPEGVERFAESGSGRGFGISLLLGFLILYGFDRFLHALQTGSIALSWWDAAAEPVVIESRRDFFNLTKTLPIILSNNIVFALVIHGFSDGLVLGVSQSYDSLKVVMLIAIVIHKIPATLSLTGLMISKQRLPKPNVIVNLTAFSLSTPIGLIFVMCLKFISNDILEKFSDGLLVASGSSLLYASLLSLNASGDDHVPYEALEGDESGPERENESLPDFKLLLLGVVVPLVISFFVPEG